MSTKSRQGYAAWREQGLKLRQERTWTMKFRLQSQRLKNLLGHLEAEPKLLDAKSGPLIAGNKQGMVPSDIVTPPVPCPGMSWSNGPVAT